jgi:hypothetical protein
MTSKREWTIFDGNSFYKERLCGYSEGVWSRVIRQPCDIFEGNLSWLPAVVSYNSEVPFELASVRHRADARPCQCS